MKCPLTKVLVQTAVILALGLASCATAAGQAPNADAGKADPAPRGEEQPAAKPADPVGTTLHDKRALQGYTLIAPMQSTKTYLIDMEGRVVRTWESDCTPALSAYLLENGHLLRPGNTGRPGGGPGGGRPGGGGVPGAGGRVQEFNWNGELVWDFTLTNDKQMAHHDIARLPNGNVLMIVYDKKTKEECIAAGRKPESVGDNGMLPDALLEIKPTGKTTGEVVWEWHSWDHLVQDEDEEQANFGDVAAHPELIDINYGESAVAPLLANRDGRDRLRAIGYLGGDAPAPNPGGRRGGPRNNGDWTHFNSAAYNAQLDQIVVSVHAFSEIWIIDHSTTTAEAASHRGGRSGKGGDLLYRWGNPRDYRAGEVKDQQLFSQHNADWIPKGYPGEGNLMVFNNGGRRPGGNFSSIEEIEPPVDSQGNYARSEGAAFGPTGPAWTYTAPNKSDLFSMLISGAQRLKNGNTLICSGMNGTLTEVTPDKQLVWKYVNPIRGGPGGAGIFNFPAPTPPGQILAAFVQDTLQLTPDQRKQIDELQTQTDTRLDQILTEDQRKQLKDMRAAPAPGGFDRFVGGGFAPGGGFGGPGGGFLPGGGPRPDNGPGGDDRGEDGPGGRGPDARGPEGRGPDDRGPDGGGPDGRGRRRGRGDGFGGGPSPGSLFRVYRYAADYPGLAGRDLTPGKTIEELQAAERPAPAGNRPAPGNTAPRDG